MVQRKRNKSNLNKNMTLVEILGILLIHWFADFVLQTDKQAKGKSKNWTDLLSHTLNYSTVWLVISPLFAYNLPPQTVSWYVSHTLAFVGFTFIAHTITDYFTSRLNSKLWADGKVHNFFVSVGFDQWLHYVQLFTTYYFLKNGI